MTVKKNMEKSNIEEGLFRYLVEDNDNTVKMGVFENKREEQIFWWLSAFKLSFEPSREPSSEPSKPAFCTITAATDGQMF